MKNESRTMRSQALLAVLVVLLSAFVPLSVLADGTDADEGNGYNTDTHYKFTVTIDQPDVANCAYFVADFGDGTSIDSSKDDISSNVTITSDDNGVMDIKFLHTYAAVGTYTYTFVCYNSNDEASSPVGLNIVIKGYPVITFDSNGGSDVATITVANGPENGGTVANRYFTAATEPESPTMEGYGFAGWYADEALTIPYDWASMVYEDMTLYAKWIDPANSYLVKFVDSDGTVISSTYYNAGETILAPADPVKTSESATYTFNGWVCNNVYFATGTTATKDITYTASYTETIKSLKVTYIVDGAEYTTQTILYGETVTLIDAPVKEGYTFSGWNGYTTGVPVTSDLAISGTFTEDTPETVTITVDGTSQTFAKGKTVADLTVPAKEGYTFAGWYSNSVYTVSVTGTTVLTEGMTLYAKFTEDTSETVTYTVTFIEDGNVKTDMTQTVKSGEKATEPTITGGKITCYSDVQCTTEFDFSTPITSDTTIYCKYTNVSCDTDDDVSDKEKLIEYLPCIVAALGVIFMLAGFATYRFALTILGLLMALIGVVDIAGIYDIFGGLKL